MRSIESTAISAGAVSNRMRLRGKGKVQLAILAVLLLVAALAPAGVPVGPGIAGRIYAIAWDPANADRVFIGGDTCEVFASHDGGLTWEPWSQGLQLGVRGRTYYIEDLLVLNGQAGVAPTNFGVYAATEMGVWFRPVDGSVPWTLLTPVSEFSYKSTTGFEAKYGRMVPFSCLVFDEGNSRLVAGTGTNRKEWLDEVFYPVDTAYVPLGSSLPAQYSLWEMDATASQKVWLPIAGTENTAGAGGIG